MSKTYKLEPELTKSSYDEEIYSKEIDGKEVDIIVISFYRWSEFEIKLNDKQKEEILKKDEIILSNYEIEFISSDDCFKRDVEIKDEEKYSNEFTTKIYENIYGPEEEKSDDDSFCGGIDELDENGWFSGDVTYAITCKCTLTEIKE
jgi:hypothetical protein